MKILKTVIPYAISLMFVLSVFGACQQDKSKEGKEECQKEQKTDKKMLNQLTEKEKEEGWMLLFNGENSDGWRGYNNKAFPDSGWVIENHAIKCQGSGMGEAGGAGGDIVYDQKFKDFRLKFEWKISEGGNSGVFYLAKEVPDQPIWKSAPEFQILDNANHPDANLGKNGNRKASSLYDLIPADPQNTKPYGEWNKGEIMVYEGTVVHRQNGEDVLEYHLGTDDWKELINNSKFKDYEDFGKYRKGYIGLQDHGNDVWYRNIKLKKL